METIFRINNVADLNEKFLSALRLLFKGQEIEISVKSFSEETDFLMNEPENKAVLTRAIKDLNEKENLVRIKGEDYDLLVNELKNK
jgi:hypothetical protein